MLFHSYFKQRKIHDNIKVFIWNKIEAFLMPILFCISTFHLKKFSSLTQSLGIFDGSIFSNGKKQILKLLNVQAK
jgi:hypothetical protein